MDKLREDDRLDGREKNMNIYTKTGDGGETSLLGGSRVTKDCITLKVVGELDELNSVLGIVNVILSKAKDLDSSDKPQNDNGEILKQVQDDPDTTSTDVSGYGASSWLSDLKENIIIIQKDVFKLSTELASLQNDIDIDIEVDIDLILEKDIEKLEKEIDKMESKLPELKNFILPGGSTTSSNLHLARAVCRRVERELVSFGKEKEIRSEVFQYLNRLSDFLFVSARYVNFKLDKEEIII